MVIKTVEESNLNDFSIVENGILISGRYLQKLRIFVRENEFSDPQEEITFFKKHKPDVYSRLKYYAKLYNFLIDQPAGTFKVEKLVSLLEFLISNKLNGLKLKGFNYNSCFKLEPMKIIQPKDLSRKISHLPHRGETLNPIFENTGMINSKVYLNFEEFLKRLLGRNIKKATPKEGGDNVMASNCRYGKRSRNDLGKIGLRV